MKCGIIIFDGVYQFANPDFRIQFFFDLTNQCLLGCFPLFYLSSGELPPTFVFSISSGCGKYSVVILYNRRYYAYCFHTKFLSGLLYFIKPQTLKILISSIIILWKSCTILPESARVLITISFWNTYNHTCSGTSK